MGLGFIAHSCILCQLIKQNFLPIPKLLRLIIAIQLQDTLATDWTILYFSTNHNWLHGCSLESTQLILAFNTGGVYVFPWAWNFLDKKQFFLMKYRLSLFKFDLKFIFETGGWLMMELRDHRHHQHAEGFLPPKL